MHAYWNELPAHPHWLSSDWIIWQCIAVSSFRLDFKKPFPFIPNNSIFSGSLYDAFMYSTKNPRTFETGTDGMNISWKEILNKSKNCITFQMRTNQPKILEIPVEYQTSDVRVCPDKAISLPRSLYERNMGGLGGVLHDYRELNKKMYPEHTWPRLNGRK